MKNLIILILVGFIGYLTYLNFFDDVDVGLSVAKDRKELILEKGDNAFVAEFISGYNKNLRIYGVNSNDSNGWSPVAYANYFFVASPFIKGNITCEHSSAAQAPVISIIIDNDDLNNTIRVLEELEGRRRATLIGENLVIKRFTYKGVDNTDTLRKKGNFDPRKAILVKQIIL